MISYRAVVTHYGPEDKFTFDEKNEHLRGSTPLFGFKLFDREAKNRAQGKFVTKAFNIEDENPDQLFLCNPDLAEEVECKEEWVAKMEQAVNCMQGKLDQANYRFKVATTNSYLDKGCRSILAVVYWKRGMEEALEDEEIYRVENDEE